MKTPDGRDKILEVGRDKILEAGRDKILEDGKQYTGDWETRYWRLGVGR